MHGTLSLSFKERQIHGILSFSFKGRQMLVNIILEMISPNNGNSKKANEPLRPKNLLQNWGMHNGPRDWGMLRQYQPTSKPPNQVFQTFLEISQYFYIFPFICRYTSISSTATTSVINIKLTHRLSSVLLDLHKY